VSRGAGRGITTAIAQAGVSVIAVARTVVLTAAARAWTAPGRSGSRHSDTTVGFRHAGGSLLETAASPPAS
jgi:hypothetical protein